MDAYQQYFFDLNGYLVIEDALSPEEVAACNAAIDHNPDHVRRRTGEQLLSGGSAALAAEQGRGDIGGMLTWPKPWCQPFRDLLVHPSTTPVMLELLGDGFRLDHLYGILMTAGTEGHVLHGGGTADDLTHFYRFHNGRMRCGLTVVSWQLTDADEGAGGFACIPGSHKANYPAPATSSAWSGTSAACGRSPPKPAAPSSSPKRSPMARSPGKPPTSAARFSTNTRRGHSPTRAATCLLGWLTAWTS